MCRTHSCACGWVASSPRCLPPSLPQVVKHTRAGLAAIHARPAAEREARRYLAQPQFSSCTVPVVYYPFNAFNFAHAFKGALPAFLRAACLRGSARLLGPAAAHPGRACAGHQGGESRPTAPRRRALAPLQALPARPGPPARCRQRCGAVQCAEGDALGGARAAGAHDGGGPGPVHHQPHAVAAAVRHAGGGVGRLCGPPARLRGEESAEESAAAGRQPGRPAGRCCG